MFYIKLNEQPGQVSAQINESSSPAYLLLLAHGAGSGLLHPFMEQIATNISNRHGSVLRFNFPYMEMGKKLPVNTEKDIQTIGYMVEYVHQAYPGLPVVLSGKSYGGRMSSHWVAKNQPKKVLALVYFGFPLHAPGKPSNTRATHLTSIEVPQLFIQGTNDSMARPDLIEEVVNNCHKGFLKKIDHGDHSFKIPKKHATMSADETLKEIADNVDSWIMDFLN